MRIPHAATSDTGGREGISFDRRRRDRVSHLDGNALTPPGRAKEFFASRRCQNGLCSRAFPELCARTLQFGGEIQHPLRNGRIAELWDGGVLDVADICCFRIENRRLAGLPASGAPFSGRQKECL